MTDASVTVGVLSLHVSKETKAILNAIDDLGHDGRWLSSENLTVDIADGAVQLTPDVDVIVNRLLLSRTGQAAELLGLAATFAPLRPVLNPPAAVVGVIHKLATASHLVEHDVPIPRTYFALDQGLLDEGRARFGDRAVYKYAIGTHGEGTTLIDTDEVLQPLAMNRQTVLQEFIETADEPPQDYRVYVVGGTVLGAMRRVARAGEFRTNVAEGGTVEDVSADLPPDVFETARRVTEIVGLDYAGIDLIERDGTWYVLEVNPTAGFRGFFEATGVSPAPHIARLAIERAGGSVDGDAVDRVARELDDARPASYPVASDAAADTEVIGYTERVTVSGTVSTESALAKSDTGARRTSIDLDLAASIGAGPIKDQTRVRSGTSSGSRARPIVDIVIGVDGAWHTVTASVEDREHMEYPVLLGRDILRHYTVDVNRLAEE